MKQKKTTIHDIAKELNVTASTVSRALKDHPRISQATKNAVSVIAKRLNYQPNSIATALRNGKSSILGVIVPTSDRRFFASAISGIEAVTNKAGYSLIICQSDDLHQKENANIDTLLNIQVDGIIASIAKETTDLSAYNKIISRGVPLILFDRTNDSLDVSAVVSNDYLASYKAVSHLIEQGCRRIMHFAGQQHIEIYKERLRGYKAALEKYDIPLDPDLILERDLILDTEHVLTKGREWGKIILEMDDLPDAIFSASDFAAMGAMMVLKEHNYRIPQDIAVVGFSNDLSTSFIEPALTTIDQYPKKMGMIAAKYFLDQVNTSGTTFTPRKTLINPTLIVRGSSLKIPSKTKTPEEETI
ncbi:MAG: LacI family DNA-binding transcriptional regulator [Balneolales bacterium]